MTDKAKGKNHNRALKGTSLFLALVVYFNLRSPGPTTTVDWVVMGIGFAAWTIALVRWIRGRRANV